jgi:hypothetical protein
MTAYRVLQMRGGILVAAKTVEADSHVSAIGRAGELSRSDRLEVWLGDIKIAVLRPSKGRN